ncbi:uncharacterized protein LOC119361418 [Triticum dicoccoides]|uniref:uncharacterized protein LOC119361418 n=1 Tax=Triticum dicoccoides TaxID=85692 RepID=UPI00188EDD7E|nr:uncharacterized protein LOC119361418 [Triticum dicoccoides]XP_037482534.1 uncharacterized protein LOC119361418 [Triticum dicoccoides]XP_037482538.1 uncharacterized protein LOC119361418 [Triticum dicoccoides]XP_037482542.1 uncharacterized protein LOC119361418 [Triticum dicoccoides]
MGNRENSTCKDSYTKGSLYTKTSRMIRAEDLDLIVRLDGSKYDKESTERGTCMNRTEELLYAIKVLTDGGPGSRALRGSFLSACWEGCFPSTPAPPKSADRQYAVTNGGRFFFGRERSGEEEG